MIVIIFTVVAVISSPVHGSLTITNHEYPLMHYTKHLSEEHFTAGRPLMIMLPLAEEDTTNKEVGYLIQELHTSGRWPILVFNTSYKMNENMYTEIQQHGSYIILISGPCNEWEEYISGLMQQMIELSTDDKIWLSRNPRGKYIVSIISNCTNFDTILISRAILNKLWFYQVLNAAVLFLKLNEQASNDLQQNTTVSAQGTHLELHTWYPYENSDRCNPDEGTVPVKVFTVRNVSDITRSDVFRGYFGKNLHGCAVNVHVEIKPPSVFPPKRIWNNNSGYQNVYEDGIEIELIWIIGNALNMTMDIEDTTKIELRNITPSIYAGRYATYSSALDYLTERTHGYLSARLDWYTPCAVKHQRWSRFLKVFSLDMWICFALSVVLAIITVSCISICGHKTNLHESKSYSNIFSATANIIAVLLSVSVHTQPRSAPLRLFFFCWVWYSVAISTVFQAYLTTFLIEPGYQEPIRSVQEMLKSENAFGFPRLYELFFPNSSDPVDSAIFKNAVQCPDELTCFIWAAVYHNISAVIKDLDIETYSAMGNWTDENNRPLLCEIEGGGVRTIYFPLSVNKGSIFFEFIDDVLSYIAEGGIFMHIKKRSFDKLKIESKLDVPTFDDTYYAISIRHLQTAFYLLMLGYVLAVVCFVTEIIWHWYRSKGRGRTSTSVTDRHK